MPVRHNKYNYPDNTVRTRILQVLVLTPLTGMLYSSVYRALYSYTPMIELYQQSSFNRAFGRNSSKGDSPTEVPSIRRTAVNQRSLETQANQLPKHDTLLSHMGARYRTNSAQKQCHNGTALGARQNRYSSTRSAAVPSGIRLYTIVFIVFQTARLAAAVVSTQLVDTIISECQAIQTGNTQHSESDHHVQP